MKLLKNSTFKAIVSGALRGALLGILLAFAYIAGATTTNSDLNECSRQLSTAVKQSRENRQNYNVCIDTLDECILTLTKAVNGSAAIRE